MIVLRQNKLLRAPHRRRRSQNGAAPVTGRLRRGAHGAAPKARHHLRSARRAEPRTKKVMVLFTRKTTETYEDVKESCRYILYCMIKASGVGTAHTEQAKLSGATEDGRTTATSGRQANCGVAFTREKYKAIVVTKVDIIICWANGPKAW